MLFFRRFPPRGGFQHEETAAQRFFRLILVSLIFAGVAWGFWLNSERQASHIPGSYAPRVDAAEGLDPEQEKQLQIYARRFFEEYGIHIRIEVQDSPLSEAEAKRFGHVYLGVNPRTRDAVFYAPPLAASVLGEEFIQYLNQEHFPPYFATEDWPAGLAKALSMLSLRLDAGLGKGGKSL